METKISAIQRTLLMADVAGHEEVENVGTMPPPLANEDGIKMENPKACFNDKEIGTLLLAGIDWDVAETRERANGDPFKTTTQHSFTIEDGQYKYQFGLSVNRYALTKSSAGLTSEEKRYAKKLGISDEQLLTLRKSGAVDAKADAKLNNIRR